MAFNIWKLHCKNVDLTIVIQPNILLLSLIYCTFSFIPIILSRMFIPLFNTAAAYGSSLWHKYGNHEQGGHIKFHSKNKYLATHLIRLTQHEQQISPPHTALIWITSPYFWTFVFLLIVAGIELSIQIPSCWLLQNTEYTLRTQNTVVIITEATTTKKSLSNTDLHLLFYNRNGPRVTKPIQRFTMSVAIEPLCFWEVAKLKTCIIPNLQ